MTIPKFGLNRFDNRSVADFAADVKRAEALGWDVAFQNDAALGRRDAFVMLAAAALNTEHILLGPLIVNPVTAIPPCWPLQSPRWMSWRRVAPCSASVPATTPSVN